MMEVLIWCFWLFRISHRKTLIEECVNLRGMNNIQSKDSMLEIFMYTDAERKYAAKAARVRRGK